MKNSLFRYLCMAVVAFICGTAGAQQKANYQLAEKFRLLTQNPVSKYSAEVRPTFINDYGLFLLLFHYPRGKEILLCKSEEKGKTLVV